MIISFLNAIIIFSLLLQQPLSQGGSAQNEEKK